ncbi:glycosyltransferase [Usitatibacter palustris]|uniref:O-mycaminosyltylonolide 6-deoxyallosyltransferase n=1 Tax=Usitatibacter palustris TaxID=2732487 RepID=A0A6M4H8F5_9PROT|nr:glycosyltransferase [Usitatibacter palustris]QJR14993.1 O-mycaminosyltylonolide 6-deoxyallosyltransferase [Usitatibacter palustris]
MARVVLCAWGSYGDLFPYIGIALELKRRGHRPLLAHSEFYRTLVEGLGLEFHAVPPDIDPQDKAFIALALSTQGPKVLFSRIAASVRESYAAIDAACGDADLVVTHPATPAAPLVAQKRGLPWVSTVLAPISFLSAYELPLFPPYWLAHLYRRLGPGFAGAIVKAGKWTTTRWVAPVQALRAELGLPPAPNPIFDGQFSPLRTLALFPRVLAEPQPDWPANVDRTGFVSYSGPDEMPTPLVEFLDAGPPPVVFTLGTSAVGLPGTFFEESAKACELAGVRGVLLVGRYDAERPTNLPSGVIAVDYAPHAELFPRAAAIVHQCGMGTLSQALRAGKPQLAVPFANDQPDNADRVNRLGVARVCYPGRYGSSRVAAHLRELLDRAQYGTSAKAIGLTVSREDGATAACNALEEVLRSSIRRPS